jgi:hypothetical protein
LRKSIGPLKFFPVPADFDFIKKMVLADRKMSLLGNELIAGVLMDIQGRILGTLKKD